MEPVPKGEPPSQSTPKAWRSITPRVPDHELLRRIGEGSYGEVWLARNTVGTLRAVKVVYRNRFKDERPYEREFSGIQKYEPISRSNEGLVDVLQIGRNDAEHYFYYVMELADDAGSADAASKPAQGSTPSVESYAPKTLAQQIRLHQRLSVEECITLGLNLNLALGHLHRNGLIHRDVKPSNIIFVNGVPKLADIGLVTEMAEAESFVGTEGFIPPEGPNSPQADIYALGKVLYEASMAKDRREFPEPYSNLGTDEDSRALMELNAVLLRACAPNPRERYQSAEEMNADLALLHSGKSVQQKQLLERRLKIATRVGIGLAATLVLGAFPYYLAITQAHRANILAGQELIARKKAQAEAGKAAQSAGFLRQMLESVGPSIANGRDTKLLKEILDEASERVGKELKDQPEAEAEMCGIIGKVYNELGLYDRAEPLLSRAAELQKNIPDGDEERAVTLDRLAFSCLKQTKIKEAEKYLAESLALQRKIHGTNSLQAAVSLNNLGMLLEHQNRLPEAEEKQREALKIHRMLFGDNHEEVATSLVGLAVILHRQGHFAEAETNAQYAVEIRSRLSTNETTELAGSLNVLAATLSAQKKFEPAIKFLNQAVRIRRKLLSADHPDLAKSLQTLGTTLFENGNIEAAEKAYEECLEIRQQHPEDSEVAMSLECLAAIKAETDLAEAEKLYQRALAIDIKVWGSNSVNVAGTSVRLARVVGERGSLDEAESLASSALQVFRKVYATAPAHPDTLFAMDTLAATMRRSGKMAEAEKLFREVLTNRVSRLGEEDPQVYDSRERLARTLRATDQLDEAEGLLRRCLTFRETNSPGAWVVYNTQAVLGGVLADRRQYEKAEELLLSAFQGLTNSQQKIPAHNRSCVKDTGKELVKLYQALGKPEKVGQWEALLSK